MSDQALAREQFVPTLQACMDAKGWHVTVDEHAGIAEPFTSQDEAERATADKTACMLEQGIDPAAYETGPTETELRAMYPYDVDTYRCLVAQGVPMEQEPPSIDVYVEQGLPTGDDGARDNSDSWWPYFDPAVLALPQAEVAALEQVCPTRWVFAGAS